MAGRNPDLVLDASVRERDITHSDTPLILYQPNAWLTALEATMMDKAR